MAVAKLNLLYSPIRMEAIIKTDKVQRTKAEN